MANDAGEDEHFLMDCWNYNFFDNTPNFTSMLQSDDKFALWNSNKFVYNEQIAEPIVVDGGAAVEGRRSTRVQKTNLGRPLVQDRCREIMERTEDYILLDPYRYGEKGGVVENIEQPFRIVVHPQVSVICDIHAHLSAAEIIGFLAGKYISEAKMLYVQAAIPCTSSEQGGKDVVMDDNAQLRASEIAQQAGLSIVGWYHSHPTFIPNPSFIDLINHQSISQLTKEADSDIEPCVGLIVSTFQKGNISPVASHEWFMTKFYAGGIEHVWMPVRPIVEYPNLQCDDIDAPKFNLANILNNLQGNINNSFQAQEAERVVKATKNRDAIAKDESIDIMDVDEPSAQPDMKEEENVKTMTTSNTVQATVSEEDVDYFDEIPCPGTNQEPSVPTANELIQCADGMYFTESIPTEVINIAQTSTSVNENDCDHYKQQIAIDTCDTVTMVSGQSPTQSTTCPSTIVTSDESVANEQTVPSSHVSELPTQIADRKAGKQTTTTLNTSPAVLRVGSSVRLLDNNYTRERTPHLVYTTGYIQEVPVHPSTWYKVEFPADKNKVTAFRPSALQPVDESGRPLITVAPLSSSSAKQGNNLLDKMDDTSTSDDEIYIPGTRREPAQKDANGNERTPINPPALAEPPKTKKGGKRKAAVAEIDPSINNSRKSTQLQERVTSPKLIKKRGLPDPTEDFSTSGRKGGRRSSTDDTMTAIDLTTTRKETSHKPSGPRPPSLFTSIVFAINHGTLPSSLLARRLLERSPVELRLTAIVIINLAYHYCRKGQRMKLLDENFNKQPKINKLFASAQSSLERFVFTKPERREEFAQNLYCFIRTCWEEFSGVTGQLKYKHSENSGGRERPKRIAKPRPQRPVQSIKEEGESSVADDDGKELSNNSSISGRPIRKKTPRKDRD